MKTYKRTYLVFALVFIALTAVLYTGCEPSNNGNNTTTNGNKKYTISDYYPFTANLKTVYEGSGNEYASYTQYVDYIKGDKIQLRVDNGGTVLAQVLQIKNGELIKLNSEGESYQKEDITSMEGKKNEVMLKEPLEKGTSWQLANGTKRSITAIDVDITTPSGKYKALEVTTEYADSVTKDYYAVGKGLVKTVFTSNGTEVSSSLKEYITDTAYTSNIKVYNFKVTATDIQIIYKNVAAELKTNEEIAGVLQKYFSESMGSGTGALISKNTKINKIYKNGETGKAYIDFSKEFVTEMNAGTTKETGVLRSVTDTIGSYYNLDKVVITLDGQPYESGHILMGQDEAFKTDFTNALEVK
ncbi:MAG: GerMN domain-containing protein [Solirubrobacterales bacterium]